MRKFIQLKFFSRVLLLVMLTVTIHGVHESTHAMQSKMTEVREQALPSDISVYHHCPGSPLEQHKDCDDCDTCINCVCNASLTIKPFQFSYNPSILDLSSSDPFRFSPEVYLSLFVPPDSATL